MGCKGHDEPRDRCGVDGNSHTGWEATSKILGDTAVKGWIRRSLTR